MQNSQGGGRLAAAALHLKPFRTLSFSVSVPNIQSREPVIFVVLIGEVIRGSGGHCASGV